MNSSQYPAENRKQIKRDQRTPAYRELQRRTAEERTKLEAALRTRNAAIDRLVKTLGEKGFAAEAAEAAKLAA